MGGERFTFGFVSVFLGIIALVVYFFWRASSGGVISEEVQIGIWSALIIVFVLFGTILISLSISKMRNKRAE